MAIQGIKFTDAALKKLKPDEGKTRTFFKDILLPQLQLRIASTGTMTFFIRTWSAQKHADVSITIGTYPGVSIARAREIARQHLDEVASGHNPHEIKKAMRKETLTLNDVLDEYLENRSLKENTIKDYRRHMKEGLKRLADMRIVDISEVTVHAIYLKLSKEGSARANGAFRVLRLLMNYAMANYKLGSKSIIERNPVSVITDKKAWKPSRRRNSVIRQEELATWWASVEKMRAISPTSNTVADYFQLILLTGIRPGHLETIAKKQVAGSFGFFKPKSEVFVVSPKFTQEFDIDIPLSDLALEIVKDSVERRPDSVWLFPAAQSGNSINYDSVKHWVDWVRKESGIDFIPMDLRRTFATVAESLDLSPYTIKRLMGQTSSDKADVTSGYIILQNSRVRSATQQITDTIMHSVERL